MDSQLLGASASRLLASSAASLPLGHRAGSFLYTGLERRVAEGLTATLKFPETLSFSPQTWSEEPPGGDTPPRAPSQSHPLQPKASQRRSQSVVRTATTFALGS